MNKPLIIDCSLDMKYGDQLVDIDRFHFQEEPTTVAKQWAEKKPWMYTVLRRGDSVKGYGIVIPLKKLLFEAIRNGEVWEDGIGLEYIADIHPFGFYIASIASSPEASERERTMLVGATIGQVLKAPIETITIAISDSGERMCKMVKMDPKWSSLAIKGVGDYKPTMFSKQPERRN